MSDPAENDRIIHELLGRGVATTVEKQDWRVDREAPPFVEGSELIRFMNNCSGVPRVMHLGMGDGSANEQFKRYGKHHYSVCFADRVYVDPRDIIDAFIEKALVAEAEGTRLSVANILRAELLIPASIGDVTSTGEYKLPDFREKDEVIRRIFAEAIRNARSSEAARNLAGFTAIRRVLTEHPDLLLPEQLRFRRDITRLGINLSTEQLISPSQRALLEEIRSRVHLIFPNNTRRGFHIIADKLRDILLKCDMIVQGNFRDIGDIFSEEKDGFDLIEGTRSDAFLHREYPQFLKAVVGLLKDTGIYISDGIVSSYSYHMYYPELKAILDELSQNYQIRIVLQIEAQREMPPTYVAGIIVTKKGFDSENIPKLRGGYIQIPYADFETQELVKKQLAWTFLFQAITKCNALVYGREIPVDIERIAPELVDQFIVQIVREFDMRLFAIARGKSSPEVERELAQFLERIIEKLKMYSSLVY